MAADVAERRCTSSAIGDGMQQHIRIRWPDSPSACSISATADDKLAPLDQPMHIVTHAKTRHIYQSILS